MNASIFNISNEDGKTDSERILARICRKTFLSLWTYPSLYHDKTQSQGKRIAKEVADLIVVFGNNILIFSDKVVSVNTTIDAKLAWKRFYKSAILDSAKQLWGAKRFISTYPNHIYLDKQFQNKLSLNFPSSDKAIFHLIAVTRGSFEPCRDYFGGGGLGTHFIDTRLDGLEEDFMPFTVGDVDKHRDFIHVFDEFTVELLVSEFDTAPDFINYLASRKELYRNPEVSVVSPGEEQLFSVYMRNERHGISAFLPECESIPKPLHLVFDESFFESLKSDPQYLEKKQYEKIGSHWDTLIEGLVAIGDPKHIHPDINQSLSETESAVREIASESRTARAVLCDGLLSFMKFATDSDFVTRTRVCSADPERRRLYVFLLMCKLPDEDYSQYQFRRASELHARCKCCRLNYPGYKTIIGLGMDHPLKDYEGHSENLLVYEVEEIGEIEIKRLEEKCKEAGMYDGKPRNMA